MITKQDYENLSAFVEGVARVVALTHDENATIPTAEVRLIVLPLADMPAGEAVPQARLKLSPELRANLERVVANRKAIGTTCRIMEPEEFVRPFTVQVKAVAIPTPTQHYEGNAVVAQRALRALHRYFHPTLGGSDGTGFPFGAGVSLDAINAAIRDVAGITYIEGVQFGDADSKEKELAPDHTRVFLATSIDFGLRVVE
jgi:hypothetical protein